MKWSIKLLRQGEQLLTKVNLLQAPRMYFLTTPMVMKWKYGMNYYNKFFAFTLRL